MSHTLINIVLAKTDLVAVYFRLLWYHSISWGSIDQKHAKTNKIWRQHSGIHPAFTCSLWPPWFQIFPDRKAHDWSMEVGNNCVRSQAFLSESAVKYVGALRRGENRSKQHFAIGLVNSVLNLPEVKFFGKFKLQKNCNQCCLWKTFLGYLKGLFGYYILAATCPNGKP